MWEDVLSLEVFVEQGNVEKGCQWRELCSPSDMCTTKVAPHNRRTAISHALTDTAALSLPSFPLPPILTPPLDLSHASSRDLGSWIRPLPSPFIFPNFSSFLHSCVDDPSSSHGFLAHLNLQTLDLRLNFPQPP